MSRVGCFARSLSGHDRGCWYIIIEEKENRLLLADGKLRTFRHPKEKNPTHTEQMADRISDEAMALLQKADSGIDPMLRRELKEYRKRQKEGKHVEE